MKICSYLVILSYFSYILDAFPRRGDGASLRVGQSTYICKQIRLAPARVRGEWTGI